MNISFDFDNTLDSTQGTAYAIELMKRGYDILVTTARPPTLYKDVFKLAKEIGVPLENIIFCGKVNKAYFLEDKDYIFHLDDKLTGVPREILFNKYFRHFCEKAIEEYE